MVAAPRKRVRTLWIWYRAFERNGAATSGWPKVEIDLEVTFGLCNQMTVSQRVQSLAKRRGGLARAHEKSLVNDGLLPLRGIDLPARAYPWDCARRYCIS